MSASVPLGVSTWLDAAALCAVTGPAIARLWIFAPTAPDLDARTWTALRMIAGSGLLVLAGNSAALLWLRAADMGDVPLSDAASLLSVVLLRTHYGMFWWVRVAAIAIGVVGWLRHERRESAVFLLLGAAGIAFSHSATGHAADAGDFSAREWLDSVHMLAASAWVGMILAFLLAHSNLRRSASIYVLSAQRLSSAAWLSLDALLFTGFYGAAAAFAGQWRALPTSPYAWLVALKVLLVGVMIAFGAFNRETVSRLHARAAENESLARRLQYSLGGELVVAMLVFAVVAVLVQTSPPSLAHSH